MAGIKFNLDRQAKNLIKLAKGYNFILARLMLGLGKKGMYELRKMFLSGQYLQFRNYTTQGNTGLYSLSGHKKMITSSLSKDKSQIKISSFPLNLFEKGRAGYNDKPIYRAILGTKLKNEIEGNLSSWAENYSDTIINGELNK
jgi:hypothetical protein